MGTKIEWTDETWNPLAGCTHLGPGCDNCYAARETSGRLSGRMPYKGLAVNGRFTGEVRLVPERLEKPLHWTKPRKVFVNSMSDLFHRDVPNDYIARVFAVMALSRQHTFQVLTKRAERLPRLLADPTFRADVQRFMWDTPGVRSDVARQLATWPLPNVWLGVSVENESYTFRIRHLMEAPAAVRFLSVEPLLGPVDLLPWLRRINDEARAASEFEWDISHRIGWVIAGGESGPKARPMHPDWVREIRDECQLWSVPFLFKQWGEWSTSEQCGVRNFAETRSRFHYQSDRFAPDGTRYDERKPDMYSLPGMESMLRVGKHAAGRTLDGRTWDEYPGTGAAVPAGALF